MIAARLTSRLLSYFAVYIFGFAGPNTLLTISPSSNSTNKMHLFNKKTCYKTLFKYNSHAIATQYIHPHAAKTMSELKHEERRGVLCTVLEVEIMPHQRYRLCAVQLSPIMVLLISYGPNDLTCLGCFFFLYPGLDRVLV